MLGKSRIFLYILLSFILGVALAPYLKNLFVFIGITFLCIAGTLIIWRKNKYAILLPVCLLTLALGAWRQQSVLKNSVDETALYYDKFVVFEGVVAADPDVRSATAKLTVDAQKIYLVSEKIAKEKAKKLNAQDFIKTKTKPIAGKILVTIPRYPEYKYRDRILFSGKITEPAAENNSGFNYKEYLSRYNIYTLSSYPAAKLLSRNKQTSLTAAILKIREQFEEKIFQVLPEPHASFLGGLILGAKKSIPQELMDKFNKTGMTHIVALSGFNITIIAVAIAWLVSWFFPRKTSFWFSLLAISFFITLTGFQASCVRAGIMGMLVALAKCYGRFSNITNSLAVAAVIMLAINPKILAIDTGFQLSFLATLGIVYLSPFIEKFFKWLPETFEMQNSLVMTLSAQILVIPKIILSFSRLSLISPIVNVLVLPVIPMTMFFGFVTGISGQFSDVLAKIFGFVTYLLLDYEIRVVDFFSKIPYAAVELKGVGMWLMGIYFFIILLTYLYFKNAKKAAL